MSLPVQTDIAAGLAVADVVHLHQLRDICRVCTDLGKGQGHPDGPEECPECLDTLQRRAFGIVEVHLTPKDPDSHLGQTLFAAVLRAVVHPRWHDDRQTRAVGAIILGGEHVLQMVAVPVLLTAHAHNVIVAHHTGPHDVCTGLVIVGILHDPAAFVEHGQQHALQHPVRHFHVRRIGEVALKGVGHDVRDAAGRLIGGQAFREGRVQHGEAGTEAVGLRAVLLQRFLVGDDGIRGAFAAGGGNGQDGAPRQSLLRHLPGEKIPEITVIGYADGDGLGGIDDAAAAHRQNEVDLLPAAQFDSLVHQTAAGIGLDAPQLHSIQVFFFQAGHDPVQQAGAFGRLPAVDHQHPAAAEALDIPAGLRLPVLSEHEVGRAVKIKVPHRNAPLNIRSFSHRADRRTGISP